MLTKKPTSRNANANQKSREKQTTGESETGSLEIETEARIPSTKEQTKEKSTFALVYAVIAVLLSAQNTLPQSGQNGYALLRLLTTHIHKTLSWSGSVVKGIGAENHLSKSP